MNEMTTLKKGQPKSRLSSVMRRVAFVSIAVTLFSSASEGAETQSTDWRIGKIAWPRLVWGLQEVTIPVRNISSDYKILVAQAKVISIDKVDATPREVKRNHYFEPGDSAKMSFALDVPENFSRTKVAVAFYEVVDTLDDLRMGHLVMTKEFEDTVAFPPGLLAYRNAMPRLSRWSGHNENVTTDLALVVGMLLGRDEPYDSVAAKCGISVDRLIQLGRKMMSAGYMRLRKSVFQPMYTTIDTAEYRMVTGLLDSAADKMATALTTAVKEYKVAHAQRIAAGTATPDKDDIIEGTAILHHLYPVIGGLVFWERLAPGAIGDTALGVFSPWGGRTPCDGSVGESSYLLTQPSIPEGEGFYYRNSASRRSVFGLNAPALECSEVSNSRNPSERFGFPMDATPKLYFLNPGRCDTLLQLLTSPCAPIRDEFFAAVTARFGDSGVPLSKAERLWLWNLLTTRAVTNLVANKILEEHSGEYFVWIAQ